MKKIFLSIAAIVLTMSVQAQSSLDYKLHFKAKVYNQQKISAAKSAVAPSAETISVIGTLKDGLQCPTQELEAMGVKVVAQYYGLVVMKTTIDMLEALGKVDEFSVINADEKPQIKCDESHKLSHVLEVQDPTKFPAGLSQTYTGKNVIIGIVDKGFDFQHKNFKDADGKTRIKQVWLIQDGSLKAVDSDKIDTLKTDDYDASHGSHTVGTAAGSYNGEYTLKDGSKISGLRGAAYESDIILSGLGSDANTFEAVSKMWEYARAQKKPLMVSLSIGGSDAWMDGKNMYTTFFKNITKAGTQDSLLINLAAGNEGWEKKYFRKELKAGEKIAMQVTFSSATPAEIVLASDDKTPFNVTVYGYDKDGNVVHTYKLDQNDGGLHDIFGNLQYMIGNDKGHDDRFYVNIGGSAVVQKVDADYVIEISADKDCQVRSCFTSAMCSNKINGVESASLIVPEDNNSLSTWVQHKYAFAVGAYTSRVSYPLYSGEVYGTLSNPVYGDHKSCTLYGIAPFSSWSDVPYKNNTDSIGVDFLSPGNVVLSSVNHYDTTIAETLVAKADDNNYLGAMYGTSMATPNASGIMALWLQACPSLSVSKVREIIKNTAVNDDFAKVNPRRAGYGKINCLAGLQEILKEYPTAISDVSDNKLQTPSYTKYLQNGRIIIEKNGKKYNAVGQEL